MVWTYTNNNKTINVGEIMKRTLELNVDVERLKDVDNKEYSRAMGRICTYAVDYYDEVKVYNDGDNDLVACYYKDGVRKFVMGAVWRGTEYSFHS